MLKSGCFILWMLIGLVCFESCSTGKNASTGTTTTASSNKDDGRVSATVMKYEVDGCTWLLVLESGEKLATQTLLPLEFAQDGLKVIIKYENLKDGLSTCMAGKMIKLVEIKRK